METNEIMNEGIENVEFVEEQSELNVGQAAGMAALAGLAVVGGATIGKKVFAFAKKKAGGLKEKIDAKKAEKHIEVKGTVEEETEEESK